MARIRTIKPEAWESEDLASVPVTAVLTFIGLLTQADDAGRHRDLPAVIAGRLWALRPDHTPAHVAQDLEQLAERGLICRYTGCDGKTWLHIVTWDRHQKINRPSVSRLPRCPLHEAKKPCGECGTRACPAQGHLGRREGDLAAPAFMSPHDDLMLADPPAPGAKEAPITPSTPRVMEATSPEGPALWRGSEKVAGQSDIAGSDGVTEATFTEGSGTGSRILDPGSSRRGREAPAPVPSSEQVLESAEAGEWSAKRLMAEYLRGCSRRPPKTFLGHLGKEIRQLLDEGFEPDALRPSLDRLRAKGLHPSVLPSLVNEVVNSAPSSASGAGPWAAAAPAYTPYLNPTAPTGTFGVAL
ncbi:hypothetical protein [Streptomyces sp. NRRL F-5193]|uniref:hypothetical protein n=1 Tax=Streptomyces sp. NRRL F-5193 TaxID=1463860 RepID=UPI00068F08E9|nr:hypothetical protein [Streptomyces sp. NRRL F-5193]